MLGQESAVSTAAAGSTDGSTVASLPRPRQCSPGLWQWHCGDLDDVQPARRQHQSTPRRRLGGCVVFRHCTATSRRGRVHLAAGWRSFFLV